MVRPHHHWLHPQTIPRGFLRLYILTLLSRGSETGYSVIQKIDERTDGAWRPGAGTMYPLLKGLLKEGLVSAANPSGRGGSKVYSLTTAGRAELERIRKQFASAGRKEPVMVRLFSDLLPGSVYVPMVVRRYRDAAEVLRQKVGEVPQPERTALLREFRLHLQSQIDWIDSEISMVQVSRRQSRKSKPRQRL
jgi:DNA-binding PadR family transcriptional regulator